MRTIVIILGMLFTLSVNAQVTISPSASSICLGQTETLTVQVQGFGVDTLVYQWLQNSQLFGAPSNDTLTVTPAVGVWNYSVAVSTPGGQFVGTGFATVTVNTNPTATASNAGSTCVTQTISLTASGGSSYSWSGPGGYTSSNQNPTIPNATLAMGGVYTVTVTDGNGCSADTTTSVVVNANPIPTISVSPNDTVCLGTQVALFATGGVSYSWSMGGSGSSTTWTPTTIGNLVPSVFVTDANGCSAAEILPMVVNPTPSVTVGIWDVACFGDSTGSLSVSQSGLSYLWNTGATTQTISGLPAGNYSVTGTNNFGCSATTVAVITQPTAAVTASVSVTDASCNGNANGEITVSGSGGNAPYQYRINNGPWIVGLSYTFTGLVAGTYTIDVRDANACQITLTASVFQPSALTANADSSAVSCFGYNDGAVWVTPLGGTPPYTYVWSNGATTQFVSGLTVGTYSVTVTDANGCIASAATAVTQPTAITLSAQVTSVTCNGGNNGIIDLTVSGGTSPFTYLWSNGSTVQDPSGLVVGTKTVTVTDANGCTATGSWVVNQPAALVLTTSTTNATCLADGSASVNVSGGTAPYDYAWSNGGTNNFINAPAGNYTVTVTDANGCQSLALATIGTPVPVGVSDVITPIACYAGNTGAIDLTVTGVSPFTYAWSNGATTQDLTGLGWGPYSVTVTAANGCTTTQSFTLAQPAPLSASASATNVSCFGGNNGSAVVLAQGGTGNYTFLWSPSGATGSTASNLPAGAYTVTVTDANGCTAQASTVVTQPSQLLAVISNQQNIACAGNSNGSATVSVIGGTPFSGGSYNFLWSNGSQLNQAFGLSSGTHTVTVTDANGCTATTTATITTAGSPLYANMTSEPSCGNSNTGSVTASVSGGQQPYVYQWSNGASSPSVSGLAPGTYSVTITDANGCSWQGSQQITGSPNIVINLSNQTLCEGNNELINATFTGGTWPYQFIWTTPSGQTFTTNDVNPVEQGTYQLTIIDAFGCQTSGSMYITLIPCGTTSVEEVFSDESVKLFPNPISSGQDVTIQLPSTIQEVEIRMMDFVGKTVFQGRTNEPDYRISTSGLAAGTYMVQVAAVDGSASVTKKIIVQ